MPHVAAKRPVQTITNRAKSTGPTNAAPHAQSTAKTAWAPQDPPRHDVPKTVAFRAADLKLGRLMSFDSQNQTDGTYQFKRGSITFSQGKIVRYELRGSETTGLVPVPKGVVDHAVKGHYGVFIGFVQTSPEVRVYQFAAGNVPQVRP